MLADLLDEPADPGLAGDFVKATEQCRPLGFEQERCECRHHVLDHRRGRFVAETDGRVVVKRDRQHGTQRVELSANE